MMVFGLVIMIMMVDIFIVFIELYVMYNGGYVLMDVVLVSFGYFKFIVDVLVGW